MHNIIGKKTLGWIAGGALMVFAGVAQAQYLWLNEKGAKVYSDRPPPTSVPLKNILKTPRGAITASAPAETPAAPDAAAPKGPPSLAERNADFRKRAAEKAAQEQQDSAAQANKAANKLNCENARNYKQALDSGERIGSVESNGERGFMSDAKRAEAQARTDKIVRDCQ